MSSYSKVTDKARDTSLLDIEQDNSNDLNYESNSSPYTVPDIPADANPNRANEQPNVIQPQLPLNLNASVFQIAFYRRYFQLDTSTFVAKVHDSLRFFKAVDILEGAANDTDNELYGFIWITGTVIILMFISSTGANLLSAWLHGKTGDDKYRFTFDLLTLYASLFYGYNFLCPLLLYLSTTYILKFPQTLPLTQLISIYGYTNVLWFPITLVNFLIVLTADNTKHHEVLNFILAFIEWFIVLASGAVTGASILLKTSLIIKKNCFMLAENNTAVNASNLHHRVTLVFAVAHFIFTVLVRISFFGIYT